MKCRASLTATVWLAVVCSVAGEPPSGTNNGGYQQDNLQNLEYGAPSTQYGTGYGDDKWPNERANYDFQYEVYGGGNYFGHQESRQDVKTQGKYHVLLPDGRRQVVTYWADETGYHPTITYEDAGSNSNSNYGAPVGDNSLTPPPQNRYSSRIKRQYYSPEDNADSVQIYGSQSNPLLRFRNRKRRFTPKKGYVIVYPDLPSVTQPLRNIPQ